MLRRRSPRLVQSWVKLAESGPTLKLTLSERLVLLGGSEQQPHPRFHNGPQFSQYFKFGELLARCYSLMLNHRLRRWPNIKPLSVLVPYDSLYPAGRVHVIALSGVPHAGITFFIVDWGEPQIILVQTRFTLNQLSVSSCPLSFLFNIKLHSLRPSGHVCMWANPLGMPRTPSYRVSERTKPTITNHRHYHSSLKINDRHSRNLKYLLIMQMTHSGL